VFVAVLGASSYTFAEATTGQDLRNWIAPHIRAWEFFGGVAEVVVPDNLKSAVTHPSYYEPDLNPTYRDLGEHYGVAIIPARPYRARDKAKVEVGVQVVQRWIVAALRKRKFFSLEEVNQAIAELLTRLSQRRFRKREGSRATLFAQLDRPALKPLPATRYEFGKWKTARVNLDYHIEVERHYYSVPYALVHQEVDVRLTAETLEVLHRGVRVASHARSYQAGRATTLTDYMPKAHQEHVGRTPSRLMEDAHQIGSYTGQTGGSHSGGQAASRNGISIVSGDSAVSENLSRRAYGSGRAAGPARARLQRPERGVDPQEPARPSAAAWRSARTTCRGARQHPRR
jgi:transposase